MFLFKKMDAVFELERAAAEVVGEGLPGTLCEKQTISAMGKPINSIHLCCGTFILEHCVFYLG